jgi:RNA polymerase sigma factor (sigma-70 family)
MTQNDSELLRTYVHEGSEAAFTELVNRHVGLVYSAALRQVNGASQLAEDITQNVFASLAKKASGLTGHTSIAGWLHTSVRYASSDLRRSEQRRSLREQGSFAMNELLKNEGPALDWEQLRPIIDDTLNELDEEDREAILLRFFQGCALAEIGARLGVQENTARMRVERALEKLRLGLSRRKITSTAAAIASTLTGFAMSVAPARLAARVSRAVLAGSAAAAGGGIASLLGAKLAQLLIAAAVTMAVVLPFALHVLAKRGANHQLHAGANPGQNAASQAVVASLQNANAHSSQPAEAIKIMDPRLEIHLDDPKTGKPVAGVTIDDRWWSKSGFKYSGGKSSQFFSDKNGWCEVTYPSNVTDLELTTRLDGYADTRLEWHPDHGDYIPPSYNLHLAPGVPIGGQVVDANGAPVAGAMVGWNHEDAPLVDTLPESHQFGWIEVATDADGHWQINRIAEDMIRRLYGGAREPDHVDSGSIFVGRDPSAEKELRAGTFVIKLGNAVAITGSVLDGSANPVPGAKVFVGTISSSDLRNGVADNQGNFTIAGCKPGDNLLTASAPGLANTTEEINTTNSAGPYRIVLTQGGMLDVLVQNPAGVPIPHVSAWLDCYNQGPFNLPHYNEKRTQVDFNGSSDLTGHILWTNAPAGELKFEFSAPGYVRSDDFYLKADGIEHTVTLHPALVIAGTVRDADSGEPIPHFRMGIGWPEKDYVSGQTNGHWSSIARFWPEFSNGQFSNTLDEAAISGMDNPGYILKFEADGYQSFASRAISPDEGPVQFDVALHRAVSIPVSVIDSNGQPAANVDVGLAGPGAQLSLLPGGFAKNQSSANLLQTDSAGHFNFTPDDAITRVILAGSAGYAKATPADLQNNSVITLQAWGRIEGTCMSNRKPVAGRQYLFDLFDDKVESVSADFNTYRVTSDEQGKFVLPTVPPGKHYLVRLIPTQMTPGGMGWMHGDKTEVDVLPGQTTPVTFGSRGYTVTAELQWPDGAPPPNIQNMMVSLHTPAPKPPPQIVGHPDLIRQYHQSPEFQAFARKAHQFPMTANADGTCTVDDIPPGTYALFAFAMLQPEAGKPFDSMEGPEIFVTVPEDPPTGQVDAGTIEMRRTSQ